MILAIGVPIVLSVLNIVCFCSNKVSAKIYKVSSTLTVFVGGFLYLLLYCLMFDPGGDWNEQVYSFQTHYSVSTEYMPTLIILALVGLVGYFTLLFGSAEKLPPTCFGVLRGSSDNDQRAAHSSCDTDLQFNTC